MSSVSGGIDSGNNRGGTSCNTPPLNPIDDISGGEDALVVGFGVEWDDSFEDVCEAFDKAKVWAGEGREIDSYVGRGEFTMCVQPKGFLVGGGRGSYFAWSFKCGGLSFGFSKLQKPHDQTPNFRVDCSSIALMESGARKCFELAGAVIESLGGKIVWNKVSRVDICIDWAEKDIEEFVEKAHRREVVRRARKCAYYEEGYRWTGMMVGAGGDIAFRCYDKELESRKQVQKRAVMVGKRWGREVKTASRFEYQVRRAALKSMGIDDFDSYWKNRAALARYLFGDWLRFVEGDVDRGHTERATLDRRWAVVCEAVASIFGKSALSLERTRTVRPNAFALVRQSLGCLISAVATESGGWLRTTEEMKEVAIERLVVLMENLDLEALHEKAMLRVAVEYPTWAVA